MYIYICIYVCPKFQKPSETLKDHSETPKCPRRIEIFSHDTGVCEKHTALETNRCGKISFQSAVEMSKPLCEDIAIRFNTLKTNQVRASSKIQVSFDCF